MKKVLRLAGYVVGGLVGLLLLVAVVGFGISNSRINKAYAIEQPPLAIPSDSASIARGEHIAVALGKCSECHGANLGGTTFIDEPALGSLYSANLTRGKGGIGAKYTDADWVRTIKHGVRPDGKSVIFMPSQEFGKLSDADLAALIAYLKQVPPVDNVLAPSKIGPVFRALHLAGVIPLLPAEVIDHEAVKTIAATPAGATPEYGNYLATVGGCRGCHGEGLSGGPIPGAPPSFKPASNLTPSGIGHYAEADFFRALREGKRPDGSPIDTLMPSKLTKLMTDDEISALYQYLKTVPAKAYGNH